MAKSNGLSQLLDQLDSAKRDFHVSSAQGIERLLDVIGQREFPDAESLIRFHESLLFIRAYPRSRKVLALSDRLLSSFVHRVARLPEAERNSPMFDYMEYSGIAGTTLVGTYSYGIARWLARDHPAAAEIDWRNFKHTERLGYVLPQFLPLLGEDTLVEQNIPYQTWLSSARRRPTNDLAYLVRCFEESELGSKQKSALYDLLGLWIEWKLGDSKASRTNNRDKPAKVFYHRGPLIARRDVSLKEIIKSPLRLKQLSRTQGHEIIDRCRATTCVRYRELYGIPYGDESSVVRADVGRGVEIYLWGLPAERRLPLRAYHAGFTVKNGVPVNYIEGITLFERMEIGFNTFYTYREGESAWIYAQGLRALHHLTGATCFSIDPYQIGLSNDEAIESGAFWFYSKLGFRSTRADLMNLAGTEEKRIASNPSYRTPERTLKRLSQASMIYELPLSNAAFGQWDKFTIRNVCLAVQRRMAAKFGGDARRFRTASVKEVAAALGVSVAGRKHLERSLDFEMGSPSDKSLDTYAGLVLVLALVPDLPSWTPTEKTGVLQVIRAKSQLSDAKYARLLQDHPRLRKSIIAIGSKRYS